MAETELLGEERRKLAAEAAATQTVIEKERAARAEVARADSVAPRPVSQNGHTCAEYWVAQTLNLRLKQERLLASAAALADTSAAQQLELARIRHG